MTRTACIVNLGTPTAPTPTAVRAFLREFLSDPLVVDSDSLSWKLVLHGIILPLRPYRVARQYASIWTEEGSPLAVGTTRLVEALRTELGAGWRVEESYCYGAPSLADAIRRGAQEGETLVVPLFPQRTSSTLGSIELAAARAAARSGAGGNVRFAHLAPDDPGYVAALAGRTRAAFDELDGPLDHLVVSFHGIPVRYDRAESGIYQEHCRRTAEALATALDLEPDRWSLVYQSRFGREPWLEPTTEGLLHDLPGRGARRVAVVCPGFLTDCLETLEELGVRGREVFTAAGGERFALARACEDHPALAASLASLLKKRGA